MAGPDTQTGWHHHPHHQLEYALVGVAKVMTAAGSYLLPPQQAIWIPAGLDHHTTLQSAHSIALFLDPALVPLVDDRARVIAATPVVREMLIYGLRWPIDYESQSAFARAFRRWMGESPSTYRQRMRATENR